MEETIVTTRPDIDRVNDTLNSIMYPFVTREKMYEKNPMRKVPALFAEPVCSVYYQVKNNKKGNNNGRK